MALRAVLEHPKFSQLKKLIGQPRCYTLGCLETLWHFTGRFTPQGNIGKYTDREIEAWIEWPGESGLLIAALIETRWLDRDPDYRLIVHDWHIHADAATKLALKRSKTDFVVPVSQHCRDSVPTVSPQCPNSVATGMNTVETVSPQCRDTVDTRMNSVATVSSLPVPVPVPVPVPEPEPVPVAMPVLSDSVRTPRDDFFERLYKRHPKKKNRTLAEAKFLTLWNLSSSPGGWAKKVDEAHQQLCQTPQWREQGGRWVPPLDQWLDDEGWDAPIGDGEPEYPEMI